MRLTKLLKLFSFLFLLVVGNAQGWASKVTVIVNVSSNYPGGMVCVNDSESPTEYGTTVSKTNDSGTTHNFWLYAKANSGYRFVGWYTDDECTAEAATANPWNTAIRQYVGSTTKTYYAKFEVATVFYNSAVTVHAIGNGKVFVSTDAAATPTYGTEVSASITGSGDQKHTYYLKTQEVDFYTNFLGWYKDVACTDLISSDIYYTYKVDGVEGEPTTTHVYAKFKTNNPYQLLNSDFEVWNSKGNEPAPGWNSFESATGSLAGIGKSFAPQPSQVEGRSGNAVKLISKNAMGANANGNLTTGYVNMGSATPSSTDNHNYTDTESKGHYMIIKGQPDAVELWTKFTASSGNQSKAGNAKFIIHDKYNYKDPEAADPQETSHRIATSNVVITESTEWTRHEAAFTYDWSVEAAAATDKYVLANITTNGVPGESAGDELIVDDVRLIYYSEIDSATYKGTCFTFGDGSEYGVDGFATVNDEYDESQLVLYCNGRGAKITKDFYPDENMLLITVEGNDIEWNETNVHYYAIQFSDAQETITTLSSPITINVNGITLDPTNIEFKFIQKGSKYSLRMENFMLDGNGIGTIVLNDITYNEGHISTTQTITIEPGTDPGVQSWIGPFLGPVPIVMNGDVDVANETMTAKIDIDMSGTIGQIVQVIAAPVNAMSDTEMIGTGLQNVKFDREFQRNGWSTICLPFAWSNAGFGGSTYEVQAFDSANDGVLTFKKVAEKDGTPVTLEANKPYLIYLDNNANDAPYYFGAEVASTTPIGDTKSGVTFIGNYEAGKSMDGLYGAVIKDGVSRILKGDASSSISIGRAYFEVAAGVEINGSRIDLEGHEGETSIDGVEMLNANAPIYNIQGIRDNATRHGIYIQNGKKFVK